MLKRAGWKEGQGLGAQEQGAMTPLEPWENDGRKGIGASAWTTSVTPLDLPLPSHRQLQQQHRSKPPKPGEGPQQRSSKQQIGAKLRKRLRQVRAKQLLFLPPSPPDPFSVHHTVLL